MSWWLLVFSDLWCLGIGLLYVGCSVLVVYMRCLRLIAWYA